MQAAAKQLAEKSDRKISEAELAEEEAETAAAIMSSATEALMSTIAKPLLEEAVARENKTIVDDTIVDDFDGYDDDFDGYDDDYNPEAYEEAEEYENIDDCYGNNDVFSEEEKEEREKKFVL